MRLHAYGVTGLLLVGLVCNADDGPPPLKAQPEPVARKLKHYVVQVKLIEVDDQGKETVIGEPRIQTAGGNAGISVDHSDGRRFEFTIRLTDRFGSLEELIPPKAAPGNTDEGLLKKLDQTIDLNLRQMSRKDILREVARRVGINVAVDPDSLSGVASEMDAQTTLVAREEAVSDVLDRFLQPMKLGYLARHESLLIGTPEKLIPAPEELIVKTYVVGDLMKADSNSEPESSDFLPLINRIKSTVQPVSWDRKDASATIRSFSSTQSIVVRQTAVAHASIERLLERIRREQIKPAE